MSTQVTQPMAENAEHRREALLVRIVRRLADSRELTLFVLVVALAVVMSVVYPNNFPTAPNMRAVLLNLAPVGILVCGMMLLMIAGTLRPFGRIDAGLCRRLGRRRRRLVGLAGRSGRRWSASWSARCAASSTA